MLGARSVFLSLISAVDYFVAFWSKIDRQVVKSRRRAFILAGGENEMCPLPDNAAPRLDSPLRRAQPNEFSPHERTTAAAGSRRHCGGAGAARTIPGTALRASGRTSRRLRHFVLPRRSTGLRRLCVSSDAALSHHWRRARGARRSTTRASRR